MLGKMEMRTPPGGRPRDGRHCDLCGCSQPAVRCDKCGCQIFCLSCDDMYHRHPKRRFHLRKAVDPNPPMPHSRPVLPMKVANINPGDPSKMPLPPPRKKKSLFGSFRRPSPSSDNSPPLPKKEYSWTDRLGSIKKFMSNRPLPPLPNGDDHDGETQPTTNGQTTHTRGDLTFIHKKNEERPPQLPARSPRPQEFPGFNQERDPRNQNNPPHMPGQLRNGTQEQNMSHMNQNSDFSGDESQWNNRMPNQNGSQAFGTMNRQNHRGYMPPGGPGFPGAMHQSSSATDLHSMHNAEAMSGAGPLPPHYPHYPMNPHMPPHYPYPMYPQFPNYPNPQYFGNSFANSSNPPTTDGDLSDSETSTRHSSKKQPFRKRAKRSQSVMMDRMAYPGQFYPFGPYPPGYGPWGAPVPMEAPPSPASSIRSLNRTGRSRRRKKMTSEEDDEEFSMSSSPVSRPKSSSSERPPKESQRAAPLATQTTSSEDESEYDGERRRNKVNTIQRRTSEPMRTPTSPAMDRKKPPKLKKRSASKQSDSESQEAPQAQINERRTSKDSNTDLSVQEQQPSSSSPPSAGSSSTWECKHCTFFNPITNKICIVCCKTASPRTETPVTASSRPSSAAENTRTQSVESMKSCSSPDKAIENEDDNSKKDKQDMAILNSALDEAEKEISRGLEELMKLKDDMDTSTPKENNAKETHPETTQNSKPVYKPSGKIKTSILDKLNINKQQTSQSSTSTSTEVQTEQSSRNTDKIIEARRYSNSSTTSETYNSPLAQSPELGNGFNKQKRDSSCQTQQDNLAEYLERKKAAEEAYLGRPLNNFGFDGYADRMSMMTSPVPSMYDRFIDRGFGMMQRSHSRASLFAGRMNDLGPMDYGGPAFGYGAAPMYRSVSRGSLTGDYPDGRMSEFHNLRKPDYYLSMEELVERRRQDNVRAQGLELVRMIREAEQQGFTADDIQVALTHCGNQSPMEWLQGNWRNMVDSVITLSTNYGNDKKENDIGLLSEIEARDALRLHKGNIWAAVTECVEGRQRKYLEISARGKFSRQEIIDALTASDGDAEMAYANLSKNSGKPFLMRIWGAGEGAQNQDGAQPIPEDLRGARHLYRNDEIANSDYLSDDLWSEDGEGVNWEEEEEEYEEERGDVEDLQTCHEDFRSDPEEMRTPESDKSDYCDAFALEDRNMSPPSDDIFFVIPEAKPEKKKGGFLSKLAALRKNSKEQIETISNVGKEDITSEQSYDSKSDAVSQNSNSSAEQAKANGALSALKNTFTAIKDTVTGASKTEKKSPCSQPERRTIIVTGQLEHEPITTNSKENTKSTPTKPHNVENLSNQKSGIESRETNELINKEMVETNNATDHQVKIIPDKQIANNNQSNLNQNSSENSLKQSDPKGKIENKKPQSLAERLKFAKQSYPSKAASNSRDVQNDSSMTSGSSSDTPSVLEKASSSHEREIFKYADDQKVSLLDKVSKDLNPTKERQNEEKQVKFISDSVRNSKTYNQQNVDKGSCRQNETHDVPHFSKMNTSLSHQNEPKVIENALTTSAESSLKSKKLSGVITKNQEISSESALKNETKELILIEPSVSNKQGRVAENTDTFKLTKSSPNSLNKEFKPVLVEAASSNKQGNVQEQTDTPNLNISSQNSLNSEELKEIENTFAPHPSGNLKSDTKNRIVIKETSSDAKNNSNIIIPIGNSEIFSSTLEKDDKGLLNGFSDGSSSNSVRESHKINSNHAEVKPEIPHTPSVEVIGTSQGTENISISREIPIQTPVPDIFSSSTGKPITTPESKSDTSSRPTGKILTTAESKLDAPSSSTGTINNFTGSKLGKSSSSIGKINASPELKPDISSSSVVKDKLESMVTKLDNKERNVLDNVQNAAPGEKMVTNLSHSIGNVDATGEFKSAQPENNHSKEFENIQLIHYQDKEIERQTTSINILETTDSPAVPLQGTSQIINESADINIAYSKSNQIETITEVLISEPKISPNLNNSAQNDATQIIEHHVQKFSAETIQNTDSSTKMLVAEQQSGQEKVEDSQLVQNLETAPERSQDVLNATTTNLEKGNAVISGKDSSAPSVSGDTKLGKLKTTRTGKLKKSTKDSKDSQNKTSVKTDISSVTSASTTSSSIKENETIGGSNVASLESGTFKSINDEPEIIQSLVDKTPNKQNLNQSNAVNESSISETDTKVHLNQVETSRSVEKLSSENVTTELQNTPTASLEFKHNTVISTEPQTFVAADSTVSENSADLKIVERQESPTMSTSDQRSKSSKEKILDSPSNTDVTNIPDENSSKALANISNVTECIPTTLNQTAASSSSSILESTPNVDVKSYIVVSSSSSIPENASNVDVESNTAVFLRSSIPESALNVDVKYNTSDSSSSSIPESASNVDVEFNTVAFSSSSIPGSASKVDVESYIAVSSISSIPESAPNVDVESNTASSSGLPKSATDVESFEGKEVVEPSGSSSVPKHSEQHSKILDTLTDPPSATSEETSTTTSTQHLNKIPLERVTEKDERTSQNNDSDDTDIQYSDESRPSSVTPPSPVDALRSRFEGLSGGLRGPVRPQSPFRRMSFNSRKQVIALERIRDTSADKPWFHQKTVEPAKVVIPKRTIKQQLEMERRVRKLVADRKVRTYRKAEIVVQLMDLNFEEEESILASSECSTLELAISYLQQECQLCTGNFSVSQIVSMTHCQHRACRECIRAYFTVQIRDRTILDLLCPFCNEPDISDEDIAQDYFNHLDIMLKKLVDFDIHELFQRKLRDRVLMKDPNFRWCSQCSSGFIAAPNLKRLVCPDCNAVTCAACRRLWERDHQGISCEAFAALKDASDPEGQAAGLAKMLTEDGISCPRCHFRYALAKGGCMHFRCIQCQHDFCSGCSKPFKMGQKCGVSDFCGKLGLHAHHPRNCLFYLRDKEPEDLQKLLDMNNIEYNKEPPEGMELKSTCQVMEQKETTDGMLDDYCGKEVQDGFAGLCRVHYVEYLGQLVNKNQVDPIQIFDNDDLELVLRRASIRLPPKRYRESDERFKEKLVNLIQEELPLDKMDGS